MCFTEYNLVETQKSVCISGARVVSRDPGEKLMTAAGRWVGGRLLLPNFALYHVSTRILSSESTILLEGHASFTS